MIWKFKISLHVHIYTYITNNENNWTYIKKKITSVWILNADKISWNHENPLHFSNKKCTKCSTFIQKEVTRFFIKFYYRSKKIHFSGKSQ